MRFVVPGRAIPKARPRILKGGGAYTPETTKGFEESVWSAAHNAGVPQYDKGMPLLLVVNFYFQVKACKVKQRPRVSRPDIDNLVKAVCDGLKGFVHDDSQFFAIRAAKWDTRDRAETVVEIEDG